MFYENIRSISLRIGIEKMQLYGKSGPKLNRVKYILKVRYSHNPETRISRCAPKLLFRKLIWSQM